MVTLVVMLVGIVSFFRIPIDLMPDTSVPTLNVYAKYSGAGPEDIEKLVTKPIEDALSSIEGLRHLQSTSKSGSSSVQLVFDWSVNLDDAMRDVQQQIDQVERRLPEEVNKPRVRKYDPNNVSVIVFGVISEDNPVEMSRRVAEEMVPQLSRIDGVGEVKVHGETHQEVQVVVDLKKLKALQLTISDVANVIKKQNFTMSAGTVQTGVQRQALRITADINNLRTLKRMVVKTLDEGQVSLRDVATVQLHPAKRRSISYTDGVRSIRLAIYKAPGANTVEVSKAVQKVIEGFRKQSQDITFVELFNSALYIKSSIRNVNFSVLYGGCLAIIVLIVFLRNFRSTLVIGVSIPVSVIAAFALIHFYGLSLNLMTIGGLALGIGMLVDNAIVVLENIMRLRQGGMSREAASIQGGNEVQSSIIASTITTLIVFLPVIFMGGVTSLLFKELALVVVFTMLVSLIAAILLIPTLTMLFIRRKDYIAGQEEVGAWGVLAAFFQRVENIYISILQECLRCRFWTILICILLLVSSLVLIPRIGSEFMPAADSDEVSLRISMPSGTEQAVVEQNMVAIVKTIREEFPEVKHAISYISDSEESDWAYIRLRLVPSSQRSETARELMNRMNEGFANLPGLSVRGQVSSSPFTPRLPNTSGDLVEIEIRGHNLDQFDVIAQQVKEHFEQIAGVQEIHIPSKRTRVEKLVKIDKLKVAEMNIPLQSLATEIKTALSGTNAGYYLKDGVEYPIRLTISGQEQVSVEDILGLTINNKSDEPIMFGNLINIVNYEGLSTIRHDDRQRIMRLNVDLSVTSGESFILEEMEKVIRDMSIPAGFSVILGGNYQEQKKSNRDLMLSLMLVVLLVYMVMAAQFESLKHPFVIMFSVPLGTIGVLWVLFLTGTTFNMQSNMGCVMLAGIVVNNAILLVDQTNRLREQKLCILDALIESGRRRLRPILMTTATTVLGLLPLALGFGDGGEAQAPLARVVMGGLISSTFITLVLVPVIYSLFERKEKSEC